jgi:hypothetical protein
VKVAAAENLRAKYSAHLAAFRTKPSCAGQGVAGLTGSEDLETLSKDDLPVTVTESSVSAMFERAYR